MLHPSTKRLIDKLSDMTRKQRVAWIEGENGTIVHDTEGYRVVLTPEPHAVLLTDGLGREIETCLPEEFADDVDAHGRPYAKLVGELYREAHRHARGAEKAIRTVLAGLDAAEVEPPAPEPAVVAHFEAGAQDPVTDETADIESESESQITHAVASLANQINAAPSPAGEPPAPEPQPEPVAEAAAQPPEPEPEPEPVAQPVAAAPEPEPPAPAPVPEPIAAAPEPAAPEPVAEAPAPMPEPEPEPVAVPPQAVAEPVVSAEPEASAEDPGSFGTFSNFQPAEPEPVAEEPPAPGPSPVVEVEAAAPEPMPEPEPAPPEMPEASPEPVAETIIAAPEPEPAPAPPAPEPVAEAEPAPTVPTLSKPISLSGIPMGFGLGAAQRVPTPPTPRLEPEIPPPEPAKPRIVIDGTVDLPPLTPDAYPYSADSDHYPPAAPEPRSGDVPGEDAPSAPVPGTPRRFNPWN